MVPPISPPLSIKILLHRKKNTNHTATFYRKTPQPPSPKNHGSWKRLAGPESSVRFGKGEEAVFGWPNFNVGWLFWSLYPVELPQNLRVDNVWLGGEDVAVGQQHMKTSTFLSGSQVKKKNMEHIGVFALIFFVWKFLAPILFGMLRTGESGGTPKCFLSRKVSEFSIRTIPFCVFLVILFWLTMTMTQSTHAAWTLACSAHEDPYQRWLRGVLGCPWKWS